jgi:hypothetical protein
LGSGASWGERPVEPVFISLKLFSKYPLTQAALVLLWFQSVRTNTHNQPINKMTSLLAKSYVGTSSPEVAHYSTQDQLQDHYELRDYDRRISRRANQKFVQLEEWTVEREAALDLEFQKTSNVRYDRFGNLVCE